jgi:T5SS/PEP-CTERM-associated repeat protein
VIRHVSNQLIIVSFAAWMAAIGSADAQTLSVGANFTTINRSQTRALVGDLEPPDTMGAAGPNHFVAFNNGSFSIFNKNGALVSQVSDTSFWTSALNGSNPGGLSDPRILYDPASQRWFATMITTDQSTNNKILFARSNTSDPTQGFKAVSYTTTNGRFADFPTLGLDANGVYIGTNNFNARGNSLRSLGLYSVPKADLLAATPSLARITTNLNALSTSTYGFTLQAAVNYGSKSTSDPEPIISTSNTAFSQYKFVNLSGTSGAGATLGSVTNKSVDTTSYPTNSPQPGTSTTIDNGDDRFSGNLMQVGNFLYAVQNITVSGRSAVRWTIADATTFNVLHQGTISDGSLSYFYPSIAVNPSGDVVVGFSGSSASTYASTYAVAGTSAGGVPGATLSFGLPMQTKAGTDFYPDTRWGDYSAVTPDPADPGVFWSHQEYAGNRFTVSGTTYGGWATQASEIIPTKSGERRWSNAAGGSYATAANYFTATAPVASDNVIFSRSNTTYAVTFAGSNTNNRASVRQGNVTWNLASGSYTLSNSSPATPSLVVGEFQGTASLALAGGTVNSVNAAIGGAPGGSGALTVNSGSTLQNSGALSLGSAGTGTLTAQNLSTVYIGTNLTIGVSGALNLNGGTIRFDGYSRASGGVLNYTSGTVQVAGNRTIDTDPAIKDFFGASPTIGSGKNLAVEGNATISSSTQLTMSGGTLSASALSLSSGSHLVSTQSSQVSAHTSAAAGSVIDATAGDLSIGDVTRTDGFYGNGSLSIGLHTVTLADSDGAVLDGSSSTSLGAGASAGTLVAAAGLSLNSGGNIAGYGTIQTPNSVAASFSNSGTLNGVSLAQPVTLPGYVKGTGTFDNVAFTGTFSPGTSPASVSLGSAHYGGELDMEIGGTNAGSDYDQLNHTLGSGVAELSGTLSVSLLNNFMPQAGDMFDIITAIGGVSGTFANTDLPALSGDLFWNVDYGPNTVELTVASPGLAGDFNGDGTVDAADYVVWRKGLDTIYMQADYDVWRAHFGENSGSGTSRARTSSAAVPEPTGVLLGILGIVGLAFHFGWRRKLELDRY